MASSSIEWTEMTWNPTTGCSKISAGCKFCYAEVMAKRLQAMRIDKYKKGFRLALHEDALLAPYGWKYQKVVFVNSVSDLFHQDVPWEFIQMVFKVMNDTPHIYQILTKRADVLLKYNDQLEWGHNIWMGVSVENQKAVYRVPLLQETNARVKFLSCEPLIGPLKNVPLDGIDWAIVGGESGRNPRPMNVDWVLDIQQQCEASNTKFFFKQWGGTIYFVGGISAVYDPIRKYEYRGGVKQLIQKINSYSAINRNILFEFEDSVGNIKKGYAFHYTVVIKTNGNISNYNLAFLEIANSDERKSKIFLIGAHDLTDKLGGYRLNDKGVKQLINIFENNFIDALNKEQKTDIKVTSDDRNKDCV